MKKLIPLVLLSIALAQCAKERPIYEATAESLQNGSLYYAQNNCKNCHGPNWDGNGPESAILRAKGITVTNFTTMKDPEMTPVDYFKSITLGYDNLGAYGYHTYPAITDSGRWDISNFLFSLAPRLTGDKGMARNEAVMKEIQEAKDVYSKNRKWEMFRNYSPVAGRAKAPTIESLIQQANYSVEADSSIAPVSPERKKAAEEASFLPGAGIYAADCAGCHGNYAEGRANRNGLINEPAAVNSKEIPRLDATYSYTNDLAKSNAMASAGALANGHSALTTQTVGNLSGYDSEQWADIYEYLRKVTGR